MTTTRNQLTPSMNSNPTSANSGAARELETRDREWPKRPRTFLGSERSRAATAARFDGAVKYPSTFRGAADRCWVQQKLESKQRRLSVNKGTREARSSKVIVQPTGLRTGKALPMRRPSGGASVVVGGVNDAHMAKGRRTVRSGQRKCSLHLEASR